MSLAFDGASSRITLASVTLPSARSWYAQAFANSMGEGATGAPFSFGTAAKPNLDWGFDGAAGSNKLRYRSVRGTDGVWVMTTGYASLSGWRALMLTYDGASTANNPVLYDGGVVIPLTRTSVPSGAESLGPTTLFVGNDQDLANSWDGLLGEVAAWSRVLSPEEVAAVTGGGVLMVPDGLFFYWPLDRRMDGSVDARDYSGNGRDGTISSAVAGENPPAIPAMRVG